METRSAGEQRPDDDLDDDSSVSGPSTPYYMSGSSGAASPSAVSAEEDDYRSETSSERGGDSQSSLSALARAKSSLRRMPAQAAASAHSNHRDLSNRLKRAIRNAAQEDAMPFDEHMIGADVLLCVQANDEPTQQHHGSGADDDGGSAPPPPQQQRTVFHAHRFILAASSEPFRAMLTGSMREASQREVQIFGVEPRIVEKMLVFIYTGDVDLDLNNVLGLFIASEMYELVALREFCKSFVLYHARDVFRSEQIVQLPEKLLLELLEHDELQIRELALVDALVAWGEARVLSEQKPIRDILNDAMEHVRFPTMSVSDLYGKVRPLVNDQVIHERLLTEALFYHLKWGGQKTGRSSQRMKPRTVAAALRKRKRVSFIQHVSFGPE